LDKLLLGPTIEGWVRSACLVDQEYDKIGYKDDDKKDNDEEE